MNRGSQGRWIVGAVAGALTVAVLDVLSTRLVAPAPFSPWNPALGVGAGLVMLLGPLAALPVVLAHIAATWWLGWTTPIGPGIPSAVAGATAMVVIGLGVRPLLPLPLARWTVRQVSALFIGSLLAAAVIGAVTLSIQAPVRGASLGEPFFRLVFGNAVGIVLGIPAVALVALLAGPAGVAALQGDPRRDWAEVWAHAAITLAVGAAGYTLHGPTGERFWSLYFIPLLWTAFRLGMPGVVAQQLLVSAEAIVLAMLLGTPPSVLTNFHFFLFNFLAIALLLAAALAALRWTERARVEGVHAQRRSEALLAGAFRVTHDALVLFRLGDGIVLDANEAWERFTGASREALLGHSLYALTQWVPPDAGQSLQALTQDGERVHEFTGALRLDDGTLRHILAIVEVVTVDDEQFGVAFIRDITERRLLERQRLQSQKLEAIGLLAGGVAHDFNNILMVVQSNAEFLRRALPAGTQPQADAQAIIDAAERGAQLTRQLLAFSRHRPDAPPQPVNAAAVIRGMTTMIARLLGAAITIDTRLAGDDIRILAAPGQLEQVLLNLAVNARDAMDNAGTLTIEAHTEEAAAPEFRADVGATIGAGRWTVLRVRDTGEGMDAETQARVFEPFFTTKAEGKGTGLGLSTVYGILRSAGGHIGVRSAQGRGTTFTLYWPSPN